VTVLEVATDDLTSGYYP